MLSDIEIAQRAKMKDINEIAEMIGLDSDGIEPYGHYKAKISNETLEALKDKDDGKLVLVTAVNPTPAGEGKTTTSIGLGQAFGKLGKKAVIALREPSLGPCFGIKGGAAGGGKSDALVIEALRQVDIPHYRALILRKTYPQLSDLVDKSQMYYRRAFPQAQYNAMTATAAAAKAQYDLAVDGASKEEKAAAAAQVRQAAGVVSEVESYLSDAMVYSPVTGEISTIIAEQGELVGSGYPVVAILDMSDMWVTFNIKETLMPGIRMGMRMNGYVPALDADVEFEVTYISPQADFATWAATRTQGGFDIRTFAVKVKPVSPVSHMRPGMSVLVDWDKIER